MNTRALACNILLKVLREGKSFDSSLIKSAYPLLPARDGAFIMHLCFGVLRHYFQLQKWLESLLDRPIKEKDMDLKILLMLGLYQLFYGKTAQHAALHATVEATQDLKKPHAKGLINGVLRGALRKISQSHDSLNTVPDWLVQRIQKDWPNDWQKILEANLAHPPLTLRVNLSVLSREKYGDLLSEKGIGFELCEFSPSGLRLHEPMNVEELPGFEDGLISVQDEAAQLAPDVLELKPNLRILDACAAPGGKAAHILEQADNASLLAIDKDPSRVALVEGTFKRLRLNGQSLCADATAPDTWWDGQPFDRILIDAPCSAMGVIRRHPDIPLHRCPQDLPLLAEQQFSLLEKLWPLLKPNGILVYATCSILAQENEDQIKQFLSLHSDANLYPINPSWGIALRYGRQVLPGQHHMDGFYYARVLKSA